MLSRTPLRDLAIQWLEQQDPNQTYKWSDCRRCPCGQLAISLGRFPQWIDSCCRHWQSTDPNYTDWDELNDIAFHTQPHTFGALLQHLVASKKAIPYGWFPEPQKISSPVSISVDIGLGMVHTPHDHKGE